MNRDSVTKLRLDRRLLNRRGWITSEERARALEDLPDASAKAITLGEASEEDGGSEEPGATSPGA